MKHTNVKICGLQSVEVLKSILNLPVDMIGLVFTSSRRQVTITQAMEIAQLLQDKARTGSSVPQMVGVFRNPTMAELTEVLRCVPLDIVQLHGQESPEFCRWVKQQFPVDVMKGVSVKSEEHLIQIPLLNSYVGVIDALLLDAYDSEYGGGAGTTFAWEKIHAYKQWTLQYQLPLIIAGGLNEQNVRSLLETYKPDGVDVSSGVETNGVKTTEKIEAFVRKVRCA